jgi:hypothetical protein
MAWLVLMCDLESEASVSALADYKDLTDEAAGLRAVLKMSQAMLTSEHSRIERRDKTIRNLKDEIVALKQPQSTASMTTSSTRPVVQSLRAAGPSLHPTAPIPA